MAGSQSGSSIGSAIESEGGLGPEKAGLEQDDSPPVETGIFGVLYTVSKEKAPSKAFVAFRLFADWIQVFLLMVNPVYGWDIDPNNKVWQAFSFIQLNYFMSVRGYTFFLICMYILAVALAANLGLCIWVSNSFKNNRFDHVWPIVWLRYFSLVFYQVLDVASLTLFLMTMDCGYFPGPTQGMNQEFPDVQCWQMSHMIHIAVAAASIAIFFVLATIFTMAEIELNPISRNLMGMAHSKVEVYGFAIKMFMTCTTVFVNGLRWMSVFLLIGAFMLCYLYARWLPHLHATINHIRVGSYFTVFWAALLYIIMAYQPGLSEDDDQGIKKQQTNITIFLWAGLVPSFLIGVWVSWLRTRFYAETVVQKFRDAPANMKARHIHKFTDARDVEIASRCCRKWVDEDNLDDEAVDLAERIIKAGMQQLPREPYMAIWWSSFLIDVQGSYISGYAELQNAKKISGASLLERFCLFIREQEHTQKASAASSGDNSNVDLLSYVEFQRNYRLAFTHHYEALLARRIFWETILHRSVTFSKMAAAIERIETAVRASERMYRQVLARHSNSVKILVLYVKFLQGVRNDPWTAARWSVEAEKLQKLEEEANERSVMDAGPDRGSLKNHDDTKGVIVMGANCLIRMINPPACEMFGFQKAEVVGKNINAIVPPPFSHNHNNYVRNYIETGQAKILDKLREFVALHKDRYVVPIHVYVTKVSGLGEDSVFMGIFQRLPPEQDTAMLWVLNGGLVLSCDSEFTDWLGYRHEDIYNRPVSDLVVEKPVLDELMSAMRADIANAAKRHTTSNVASPDQSLSGLPAKRYTVVETKTGNLPPTKAWNLRGMEFKHLYLDMNVNVDITVRVGGIGETAMFCVRLHRSGDQTPTLLVNDAKGRVVHVTSKLSNLLGTTTSKLTAGGMLHGVDVLLPPPFVKLHHQWYRDHVDVPPAWSCRSGLSMLLNGHNATGPCFVPFSMTFVTKDVPGRDRLNVTELKERTPAQMLDERRLRLVLDSKGKVVSTSNSPTSLFGLDPQGLVGVHLSYILDVLRPTSDLNLAEHEHKTASLLMEMAERSFDKPGMSWRVGVTPVMDPHAIKNLGRLGATMMAKRTIPACMVVEGHTDPPEIDGARLLLPNELQLNVELWRSDLLSGLLELDTQGSVTQIGIKDQPIFSPHLLLGLPPDLLTGASLSSILPLQGKNLLDALFTEGALGSSPAKAAGAKVARPPGKGGMRGGGNTRKRGAGPVHTVKIHHGTDGADLEITVQAVVKQDIGVGCSLYICLHVVSPRCGRADFPHWFGSSPMPGLTCHIQPSRRGSALGAPDKSGLGSFPRNGSTGSMPRSSQIMPDFAKLSATQLVAEKPLAKHDSRKESFQISPQTAPIKGVSLTFNVPPDAAHQTEETAIMLHPTPPLEEKKKKHTVAASTKGGYNVSDDGSVNSHTHGLTPPGKERITSWISDMVVAGAQEDNGHDLHASQSDEEEDEQEEEEENMARQAAAAQSIHGGSVDEDEAGELDEAGNAVNDFMRGKRLKKLVRMLCGPQAQVTNLRLRWVSCVMVLILVATDLAMFMTFRSMVQVQINQVDDLRSSCKAINRVMSISIQLSSLSIILSGTQNPNIRHLGKEPANETVAYLMGNIRREVDEMEFNHHGIYQGFTVKRQLPSAYELRYTWEEPVLPMRFFFVVGLEHYSAIKNVSMWDAGNLFIKHTRDVLQNVLTLHPLAINGTATVASAAFVNDTNFMTIMFNAPRAIMDAYQLTLDGLMQQSIDDSARMNQVRVAKPE